MRGATQLTPLFHASDSISIHAPHAGRDADDAVQIAGDLVISIHAPHAGRDFSYAIMSALPQISIHAPHAGRDLSFGCVVPFLWDFNPRAPCGARLGGLGARRAFCFDFNPRAPCGARRIRPLPALSPGQFQSTRPMRGATHSSRFGCAWSSSFQSTRPMRGATLLHAFKSCNFCISIHAPHAGRDSFRGCWTVRKRDFNPRAPCGARPAQNIAH